MYTLKQFGTYTLPVAAPSETVGAGGTAMAMAYDLPGGGAFDSLRDDCAQFGARELTKTAIVYAATSSAAITAYRALQANVGKRDRLYRVWLDGTTQEWVDARLIAVDAERTIANRYNLDVTMRFLVYSPYWRSKVAVGEWYLDDGELLNTGLVLDSTATTYTLDTSPKTITITNGGNAIVTDCRINIDAGSADITAVTISTSEADMDYTGTLTAGDELVIDCGAYLVTNDGTNDRANFSLGASHTINEWLRLNPGANNITITLTGGSTDSQITFGYYNGWI